MNYKWKMIWQMTYLATLVYTELVVFLSSVCSLTSRSWDGSLFSIHRLNNWKDKEIVRGMYRLVLHKLMNGLDWQMDDWTKEWMDWQMGDKMNGWTEEWQMDVGLAAGYKRMNVWQLDEWINKWRWFMNRHYEHLIEVFQRELVHRINICHSSNHKIHYRAYMCVVHCEILVKIYITCIPIYSTYT